MRTGPEDARHVVWTIGEFFLPLFRVFLIITTVFIVYSMLYATERAAAMRTGPKMSIYHVFVRGQGPDPGFVSAVM